MIILVQSFRVLPVQSPGPAAHTAGSGQAFKPVRGGVRCGDRLYTSVLRCTANETLLKRILCYDNIKSDGKRQRSGIMQHALYFKSEKRSRGGSESAETAQHDPASNSCSLAGIGEADTPGMILL